MMPKVLLLLVFAHPAGAQVYRQAPDNASLIFSNVPLAGVQAEPISVQPANRIAAFKYSPTLLPPSMLLPEQAPGPAIKPDRDPHRQAVQDRLAEN